MSDMTIGRRRGRSVLTELPVHATSMCITIYNDSVVHSAVSTHTLDTPVGYNRQRCRYHTPSMQGQFRFFKMCRRPGGAGRGVNIVTTPMLFGDIEHRQTPLHSDKINADANTLPDFRHTLSNYGILYGPMNAVTVGVQAPSQSSAIMWQTNARMVDCNASSESASAVVTQVGRDDATALGGGSDSPMFKIGLGRVGI